MQVGRVADLPDDACGAATGGFDPEVVDDRVEHPVGRSATKFDLVAAR